MRHTRLSTLTSAALLLELLLFHIFFVCKCGAITRVRDEEHLRAGPNPRSWWAGLEDLGPRRTGSRAAAEKKPSSSLQLLSLIGKQYEKAWVRMPDVRGELRKGGERGRGVLRRVQVEDERKEQTEERREEVEVRRRRMLRDNLSFAPRHRRRQAADKCWSRTERKLYHRANKRQSSTAFVERVREYTEMHARCTNPVKDWNAFYLNHSAGLEGRTDLSDCYYLLWMPPTYAGLGNRLLSLVSTFVYALLTNRAILLGPSTAVAQLLCNPFHESSWFISSSGFRTMYFNILKWQPKVGAFADRVEQGTKWDKKAAYADLRFRYTEQDWRFFCEDEQRRVKEAKFVGLHTDEYTVPGYYLVPTFESALKKLFPDGLVFMHTGRYLLHPVNFLWSRITRTHHAYLARHQRLVGIQVRTFYRKDGDTDERVVRCAVNVSRYLPHLMPTSTWISLLTHPDNRMAAMLRNPFPRSIAVFVTSLSHHHFEALRSSYADNEALDGSIVAVHSEGHEGAEAVGQLAQYERAILEMWLLSFSDQLIVSDLSSFGYIPSALSGLKPFSMNIGFRPGLINWYSNNRPVCAPASSEPCFITPPAYLQCGGASERQDILKMSEQLRQCSNVGLGLEVIPHL